MKTTPLFPLILVATLLGGSAARAAAPVTIDEAKVAAAGIRKVPGERLTLYTDLTGPEIDELPTVFEHAFPQWCDYFRVKRSEHGSWSMVGFLMKDKARFVAAGLLPDAVPPFENGFSWDNVLWVYEQPSAYYRRHLILHEGTHGFMNTILGGCGPMWYMEGMAEYLATHRWQDGRLTMAYMPRSRDEVPELGRIRIIQDAVAERRAKKLPAVLEFTPSPRHETEPYAWCWAAAMLLDRHPRYQARFRKMSSLVERQDFNRQFRVRFGADWQKLCEEWQLMVANLEYGYDVARSAVDFTPGAPWDGEKAVTIAADRGWQNTGLELQGGVAYQLTASGRYQVAKEPKIWWCEPGGVSIRYYQGRPLGILLAAVRPADPPAGSMTALLRPTVVGLGTLVTPSETGTLFLKINDSAGELDDNAGELKVEVKMRP